MENKFLASTRALIALIDNNYQEDGSVKIPKVFNYTWMVKKNKT